MAVVNPQPGLPRVRVGCEVAVIGEACAAGVMPRIPVPAHTRLSVSQREAETERDTQRDNESTPCSSWFCTCWHTQLCHLFCPHSTLHAPVQGSSLQPASCSCRTVALGAEEEPAEAGVAQTRGRLSSSRRRSSHPCRCLCNNVCGVKCVCVCVCECVFVWQTETETDRDRPGAIPAFFAV